MKINSDLVVNQHNLHQIDEIVSDLANNNVITRQFIGPWALSNENILNLTNGIYVKEGSSGWIENNWPIVMWHATLIVFGSNNETGAGHKVLICIPNDGRVFVRTQDWNTWYEWRELNETIIN